MEKLTNNEITEIKIVFLGSAGFFLYLRPPLNPPSGVGKTSIINKYISNSFKESNPPTCGAMFFAKDLVYEGSTYRLQVKIPELKIIRFGTPLGKRDLRQ
jgi:hypothetical protein